MAIKEDEKTFLSSGLWLQELLPLLGLKCQLKKMKTLFFQVDFGYSSLITMGIKKENQHEKLLLPLHEDDRKIEKKEV